MATNMNADVPGQQQQPHADSMLEVYLRVLEGETNDPFLDEINLGSGYYDAKEYWLQVESFRQGLFAEAGMVRVVMERARLETKQAIVDAIFNRPNSEDLKGIDYPDPDEVELSQEEYFEEYAQQIWEGLGWEEEGWSKHQHQAILVARSTGISQDWVPPHWRMLKMRHKASQSKDARAVDNLFGRVREVVGNQIDSEDVT